MTSFRLASNSRRLNKSTGEWGDGPTSWFAISVWRGLGENAFRSLHKGERVIVSGRLQVRAWETSESRGTDVDITADAIGHDLLWGTTTFQKGARASAPPPEWSTAGPQTDAWATAAPAAAVRDAAPGAPRAGAPPGECATAAPETDAWAPAAPPAPQAAAEPLTAVEPAQTETPGWANPGATPEPTPAREGGYEQAEETPRELVTADATPF